MKKSKIVGIVLLLAVLAIGSAVLIGLEIYSLQSPENYIQVRRWEWYAAGVAVVIFAIAFLVGFVAIRIQNARQRHKLTDVEPQLPRSAMRHNRDTAPKSALTILQERRRKP